MFIYLTPILKSHEQWVNENSQVNTKQTTVQMILLEKKVKLRPEYNQLHRKQYKSF